MTDFEILKAEYDKRCLRIVELEAALLKSQDGTRLTIAERDRYRAALGAIACLRFKIGWFDEAKRIAREALDA